MIDVFTRIAGAGLIAVLFAGCSSETKTTESLPKMVVGSVSKVVSSRRAGPPQRIDLTADQLAQIDEPVLQINPENLGGSDFLRRATSRRDSGLGVVEVWNSSDNAQVFLRNGVVVGTRGVGGDMISADADVAIRALGARAEKSGVRTYVVSDGDVTATEYTFRCTVQETGAEIISVADQVFSTYRMQENCVGGPRGDAVLRNEYWVQTSTGLVRKSRQWIGPRVGYFELVLVKS